MRILLIIYMFFIVLAAMISGCDNIYVSDDCSVVETRDEGVMRLVDSINYYTTKTLQKKFDGFQFSTVTFSTEAIKKNIDLTSGDSYIIFSVAIKDIDDITLKNKGIFLFDCSGNKIDGYVKFDLSQFLDKNSAWHEINSIDLTTSRFTRGTEHFLFVIKEKYKLKYYFSFMGHRSLTL